VAELTLTVPKWAPVADKAELWHHQDEADRARRAAEAADAARIRLLHQARAHDPDLPEARTLLAAWHREQLERAEAHGDLSAAADHEARLRAEDRGEHAAFLEGTGAVTLVTDPPGAEVRLHRHEEVDRVLVPRFERSLGTTPIRRVAVPRGRWLLTLHREGHRDVAYPIVLDRLEHWDGVPPGGHEPAAVPLLREGELGPEEIYVPPGWFRFGARDVKHQSWPAERRWLGGFAVRRVPVTNAEYLRFLDDLVAAGREDDALACVPRAQRGKHDGGIDPVYARRDDGTHCLVPDGDGDLWQPDWPVIQIDHRAARTFAAWHAARTGQPWRLPREPEWEKAARGVDGRSFPWGDRFDSTFALVRTSLPQPDLAPVTAFGADVSVYGVRWMAGGVREWCAERFAMPDAPLPPEDEPGERLLRGGCWHFGGSNCHLTTCARLLEGRVSDLVGFRLLREIP